MGHPQYRYCFRPDVQAEEIQSSLLLAAVAVQSLHGDIASRMDSDYVFDPKHRACVIDGSTSLGADLNRVFAGFIQRQFGDDAIEVSRVTAAPDSTDQPSTRRLARSA